MDVPKNSPQKPANFALHFLKSVFLCKIASLRIFKFFILLWEQTSRLSLTVFFTGFFVKLKRNIKWVENADFIYKSGTYNWDVILCIKKRTTEQCCQRVALAFILRWIKEFCLRALCFFQFRIFPRSGFELQTWLWNISVRYLKSLLCCAAYLGWGRVGDKV